MNNLQLFICFDSHYSFNIHELYTNQSVKPLKNYHFLETFNHLERPSKSASRLSWPFQKWMHLFKFKPLFIKPLMTNRSSHRKCSMKNAVLKSFATFTGKHLCWSLFLIRLQTLRPASLLKRDSNRGFSLRMLRNF